MPRVGEHRRLTAYRSAVCSSSRRSGRNLHVAWLFLFLATPAVPHSLPPVGKSDAEGSHVSCQLYLLPWHLPRPPVFQFRLPVCQWSLGAPTSTLLLVAGIPSGPPSQRIIVCLHILPFCSCFPTLTLRGRCGPPFPGARPSSGDTVGVCTPRVQVFCLGVGRAVYSCCLGLSGNLTDNVVDLQWTFFLLMNVRIDAFYSEVGWMRANKTATVICVVSFVFDCLLVCWHLSATGDKILNLCFLTADVLVWCKTSAKCWLCGMNTIHAGSL